MAEDKIFLLSLLMAETGVHSVAYAFPEVRIITTAVDKEVNDQFHIIPGIGEDAAAAASSSSSVNPPPDRLFSLLFVFVSKR